MSALELILRLLGVAQLTLLATFLVRARRKDNTARLGAALCVSVGAFMITSMPGAAEALGVFIYPLTAICSTHPVWFWLFFAALFADHFRMTSQHRMAVAGMAALGLVYQWLWHPGSGNVPPITGTLGVAFGAASLMFACLAPLSVYQGRNADLDERRRRIRTWFVPVACLYLGAIVITQVVVLLKGSATPPVLVLANLLFVDLLAAVALTTFLRVRVVNWMDLAEPVPAEHLLSRVEQSVLERLRRRFVPERLYAREGLTIAMLAELLDTQEHVLRKVINGGLGFRNFNDFLHSHRLREAAARLGDPAAQRVPVLTIALEAGYGSIGPFNRAFKERFGVTPTEYRYPAHHPAHDPRQAFPGAGDQPVPKEVLNKTAGPAD